jgi:hypothetical protein
MAGRSVTMLISAPKGSRFGLIVFKSQQVLGADGTATFHLTTVPAGSGILLAGIDSSWCSPSVYAIERVLTVGAAEDRGCPHRSIKKFAVEPKPSRIVVYMGEYSRLEKALYFPWAS